MKQIRFLENAEVQLDHVSVHDVIIFTTNTNIEYNNWLHNKIVKFKNKWFQQGHMYH